jgi:hypothetical protein
MLIGQFLNQRAGTDFVYLTPKADVHCSRCNRLKIPINGISTCQIENKNKTPMPVST